MSAANGTAGGIASVDRSPSPTALATVDDRPFFDRALRYGVAQQIISRERYEALIVEGEKSLVQIANFFGTAHLRIDLENACTRVVNLASLFVEDQAFGDLSRAAALLRDKTLQSCSKGGSDMLRQLRALPEMAVFEPQIVTPEEYRQALNNWTFASPMSAVEYRAALAERLQVKRQIDLAIRLAQRLGESAADLQSGTAETLFRSVMLVLFVDKAKLQLPSETAAVQLIDKARKPGVKLKPARFEAFIAEESAEDQAFLRRQMDEFVGGWLARIRESPLTADEILHDDRLGTLFVRYALTEDIGEYDRLVAKEWHRVTRGQSDDPAVKATVFLFVATGLPPKHAANLRESKEIIQALREKGLDSKAVLDFIEANVPHQDRRDCREMWLHDLLPEAESELSDKDPAYPDSAMERALKYFKRTCNVTWKGRGRDFA